MFPILRPAGICLVVAIALSGAVAQAQHLWWDLDGQNDATCLYGEITVLATNPGIYYCGGNWHPGEPAGGYCGIQHNTATERRTIFSVWDTTDDSHPLVSAADRQTQRNRFGGEGTGAHTHMVWPWKEGDTFRFFVRKSPGAKDDTTDASYWIFDGQNKKWLASATITSPNGGKKSVATIGGGLNSFLENFTGQQRAAPKLALYRLWLGMDVDGLKCLTKASGDGVWGQLHDAYFLAQGDKDRVDATLTKLEPTYGKPAFGDKETKLQPITNQPLPKEALADLKTLPTAPAVEPKCNGRR